MTIETHVEKVLAFIGDPENIAICVPRVDQVAQVVRSERRLGDSFRVTFRVLGMPVGEEFRVVGFERPPRHTPHRRFQVRQSLHGPARGTAIWTLEAEGNQTYASVDAEYQPSGGVFGRALNALLIQQAVQKHVDQMLENMKRELGGQATSGGGRLLGSASNP